MIHDTTVQAWPRTALLSPFFSRTGGSDQIWAVWHYDELLCFGTLGTVVFMISDGDIMIPLTGYSPSLFRTRTATIEYWLWYLGESLAPMRMYTFYSRNVPRTSPNATAGLQPIAN